MKILLIHPSTLSYSKIFLRLEPLGLERIAQSLLASDHQVRLVDLQIFSHKNLFQELDDFDPDAVGLSLNYMANLPEIIDLAIEIRLLSPKLFIFAGGHVASFIARDILEHADGAIDCVVRGEGEAITPRLLEAGPSGGLHSLPGIVTREGEGPPPERITSLEDYMPARQLTRKRNKYFLGVLDPCASVEFTRGCPWNCSFCSAWTFYGRSYRKASPEAIAEDLARIQEPHVFVVDDVVFLQKEYGFSIGKEVEKRKIQKKYYMETRCDVLVQNQEVFAYWRRLGLKYLFLGFEAIDEEDLRSYKKKISLKKNFEALEFARKIGITVALNIIADPSWDEKRFNTVREWALQVPEIVNLTVMTPYPGTELWHSEARNLTTVDYRLFDVQHAVLPTKLPLKQFYEQLVKTQAVMNKKHMSFRGLQKTFAKTMRLLRGGQTNFFKMLWQFKKVHDPELLYGDHCRNVKYGVTLPPEKLVKPDPEDLYIYPHASNRNKEYRPRV
jgi:hopanoid C-3 methylase HpnR